MWEDDVYPGRHRFLQKNLLQEKMWDTTVSVIGQESPESHKTIQATAIALGCLL